MAISWFYLPFCSIVQYFVLGDCHTKSSEDEKNTVKVIDPSYAWIIPTGAEKPVKIAFEGGTIVDEYTNYDRSKEVQVYKKVGVRAIFSNDICVYRNTSLSRVAA